MYTYEEIVAVNRLLMIQRGQRFLIRKPDRLQHIIFKARCCYEHLPDSRDKFIKKSAYIITAFAFLQPFDDGNKSTGLLLGIDYLQNRGMDLPRETEAQKKAVDSLLLELMISTKSYDDTEKFLIERVVNRTE